jgi:segregation and condensation protein B
MPIDILIEGLLFYRAAPQKKSTIMKLLDIRTDELALAIDALRTRLSSGATRLIETETDLQLATAAELSPFIEALRKDELKSDIGKAGAETLAIILYRAPISRAEIDRIRGVNSTFILRTLLTRGLIERTPSTSNQHSYRVTPTLLAMLGVTHPRDLPDYARTLDALETFAAESTATSE